MSTILDALRRGRSPAMGRGSASSAQTDAVLETLGYSRRRHPTRVDRIRRLFTLVIGGALIVVLLWGAVVWFAHKPAVSTATATNSGTTVAPAGAPSRAWH